MRKFNLLLTLPLLMTLAHTPLLSDAISLDTWVGGNAYPASSTTPWVQATFTQAPGSPNEMTLTLTAPNLTNTVIPNLGTVGERFTGLFLNYNGTFANPFIPESTGLSITNSGGIAPSGLYIQENAIASSNFGNFDISIYFYADFFQKGGSSTYILSNPNGISFADFNVASTGGIGNDGAIALGFLQDVPGGTSFWGAEIAQLPLPAPEPMTYASLAGLLALVAVAAQLKRRTALPS